MSLAHAHSYKCKRSFVLNPACFLTAHAHEYYFQTKPTVFCEPSLFNGSQYTVDFVWNLNIYYRDSCWHSKVSSRRKCSTPGRCQIHLQSLFCSWSKGTMLHSKLQLHKKPHSETISYHPVTLTPCWKPCNTNTMIFLLVLLEIDDAVHIKLIFRFNYCGHWPKLNIPSLPNHF